MHGKECGLRSRMFIMLGTMWGGDVDNNNGSEHGDRFICVQETNCSLIERSIEHESGLARLDMKNFMCKHWQAEHSQDENPPVFVFKSTRYIGML